MMRSCLMLNHKNKIKIKTYIDSIPLEAPNEWVVIFQNSLLNFLTDPTCGACNREFCCDFVARREGKLLAHSAVVRDAVKKLKKLKTFAK